MVSLSFDFPPFLQMSPTALGTLKSYQQSLCLLALKTIDGNVLAADSPIPFGDLVCNAYIWQLFSYILHDATQYYAALDT